MTLLLLHGWGVSTIPVYTITEEPLDLAAHPTLVTLDSPLDSVMVNYVSPYTLVDQDGKVLVDENGKRLIAHVSGQTRTNIIDLGD